MVSLIMLSSHLDEANPPPPTHPVACLHVHLKHVSGQHDEEVLFAQCTVPCKSRVPPQKVC